MKKVAIIGLGIMGHGIADNFLKSGYGVIVWNRSADKAQDLVQKGAEPAATPGDATSEADIVFEVTANDESSRAVWLGKDGILNRASPDKVYITCATLSIDWIAELANECANRGLTFFDMPMTGSRPGAESGQLILMVGGDKDKLEILRPDLDAIAKEVTLYGPVGAGTKFKLILNSLQAIHIAGFGEALRLAKQAGLNQKQVGDALAERPGGIPTQSAWTSYQHEPSPINFAVEWIAKDLRYTADMAGNVSHPLLDDVLKQLNSAIDKGFAQADWTQINKL